MTTETTHAVSVERIELPEMQAITALAEIPPLWVEVSGYLVNLDQVTHVEPHAEGAILHFANGRILPISADDRARVTALLFQADPDTETEP